MSNLSLSFKNEKSDKTVAPSCHQNKVPFGGHCQPSVSPHEHSCNKPFGGHCVKPLDVVVRQIPRGGHN